jgi:helix-turn-helix protein
MPGTLERSEPENSALYQAAQRAHYLLETVHTVAYFAPEPVEEYHAFELKGRSGYFASRAAAMGPVPAEVITATFAIFAPEFVSRCMDGVWERVSPAEVQAARRRGVDAALRPVLGQLDLHEALDLAVEATGALDGLGRALYAAHCSLDWPGDPVMDLWHAATLLREHRGDGHFAAVALSGFGPVETLVLHGAVSGLRPFLQKTRGWTDQEWTAAEENLVEHGLITVADSGSVELTRAGREVKGEIERRTRLAALAGWCHLGLAATERLVELLVPVRAALLASDIFPPGSPLRQSPPAR